MKFNEIKYVQIDFEEIKNKYNFLTEELKNSKNSEEALSIVKKINEIIEHINRQEENEQQYKNELQSIHIMSDVRRCPQCGHNEYSKIYSATTLLNVPEVYKDEVLLESPIKNTTTATYQCLKCGHTWAV